MASQPHLVLIGLPGSGKTTIGRALASGLERPFVDIDEEIVRRLGMPVSQIFQERGEIGFREAEALASEALAQTGLASVLAAGGGWAANPSAVAHLRPKSRIIYLRVSPTEAIRRMGAGVQSRPLLAAGDPIAVVQRLFDARRERYDQLADHVVETDGLGVEAVVSHLVELVSTLHLDE